MSAEAATPQKRRLSPVMIIVIILAVLCLLAICCVVVGYALMNMGGNAVSNQFTDLATQIALTMTP
jgi:hypothetical protein